MPYEAITLERYNEEVERIGRLSFGRLKGDDAIVEKFCDGDVCQLEPLPEVESP